MNENYKNLRKVLIIIFAILALFGIIILIKGECELIKIIGSVATTLSVTFALTINLTFKFDIKLKKVKNEYTILIEEKKQEINVLENKLTFNEYKMQKIENNYIQISSTQSNPDDNLYLEMKKIYEPIEEFFINNGGFGAPFIGEIFFEMITFTDRCDLSKYIFINSLLKEIHEKLKVLSCELANILVLYSYPMNLNTKMQKFEYLDIMNKIEYSPESYSKNKIEENKKSYHRANQLLKEIVDVYKELDCKYKELRYK